jgi:hypothetical protein
MSFGHRHPVTDLPPRLFTVIADDQLPIFDRELEQAMIETFMPHISKAYCNNPYLRANDASGRSLALITYLIIKLCAGSQAGVNLQAATTKS